MNLLLAVALSLQTASVTDTIPRSIPLAPLSRVTVVTPDPARRGLPFGDDKLQHTFMTYAIYTFSYAGNRALGMRRTPALTDAAVTTMVIGIAKELWDKKHRKAFSGADLIADAIGTFAGYAMLKQVH